MLLGLLGVWLLVCFGFVWSLGLRVGLRSRCVCVYCCFLLTVGVLCVCVVGYRWLIVIVDYLLQVWFGFGLRGLGCLLVLVVFFYLWCGHHLACVGFGVLRFVLSSCGFSCGLFKLF